ESALEAVAVPHRFLQRVHRAVGREALDGHDLGTARLNREHQARANRFAVEQHRARAADAMLATDVGTRQVEVLADEVDQCLAGFDRTPARRSVDGQVEGDLFAHSGAPVRSHAARRARRTITPATCLRYADDACTSDGGVRSRAAASAAAAKASSV